MSIAEIRAALTAELDATPEYVDFKVLHREREGSLWRITLQPGYCYVQGQKPGAASAQALLDDSLDGAQAWWGSAAASDQRAGQVKGGANVLAVSAEDDQLILQHASSAPPRPDALIRLYPSRFLQPLSDTWWDTPWAERALASLAQLAAPDAVTRNARLTGTALTGAPFRWLRVAQRQALALVQHRAGYLWGPPGTGKTTTLGVLVAEYLDANPLSRVLLLSTTNHAVDQATVAVDKALHKGRREKWRSAVQRLGTRIDASLYAGREHLIPADDAGLIGRLARAEAARPSSRDLAGYEDWAERVAALRAELRTESVKVLRHCRLASMTTTRAVFTLKTLRELAENDEPPFDLLVFDEASQVSLAHTLALMPLARAWLFAGDPQQLSPVLRSSEREARLWLGRSAFAHKPSGGASVALLDEQSRMAPPISALVSDLFYDGALKVAADVQGDTAWQAQRALAIDGVAADVHVHLEPVAEDGGWSAALRGPVRVASAAHIAQRIAAALQAGEVSPAQVVVLTPFRAQRALIRARLDALDVAVGGPDGIKVSTVHRAQGSEAALVIFDPVDGRQPFLRSEEARRLINVALSRAQAKVIVYLSPGDAEHPVLAQIAQRQRLTGDARPALDLLQRLRRADFPIGLADLVGQRVAIARHTGEVKRVARDGLRLWLVNGLSGAEQEFDLAFLRRKALAAPGGEGEGAR